LDEAKRGIEKWRIMIDVKTALKVVVANLGITLIIVMIVREIQILDGVDIQTIQIAMKKRNIIVKEIL
jgi:hypothetical protein